jgi:hypothetical protein
MTAFSPEGWESVVIPGRALYAGFVSRTAWGRGPFGIFDYDFVHEDAGDTSVTFLFHRKTGYRLAAFMGPELAIEGVALIEGAADWDQVLKNAKEAASCNHSPLPYDPIRKQVPCFNSSVFFEG